MLTLLFAVGIPVAYVLAGMFISRSFWFRTRNRRWVPNIMSCSGCRRFSDHKKHCVRDNGITLRFQKAFLLVFFWPIGGAQGGIGYFIRKFYQAPVRKLERSREKLEEEIEVLRQGAEEFERGTASWQTMMDMASVKTKELKGMK